VSDDGAEAAEPGADSWPATRRAILRDSLGVALATGAYGVSFGAIAIAGGLDGWQAMALSALMFTGASQFGLVGVLAGGGNPMAGAATAILLGVRNALYGLRLATLLDVRGRRRLGAAHLVIDESTAMSIGRTSDRAARLGFYATGLSVLALWNLGTLVGVVGASALQHPRVLGLDAAVPAAFLALLGPRLRGREAWVVALVAAMVAVLTTPLLPPGLPVLAAAAVAAAIALAPRREASVPVADDPADQEGPA
jgi:predicted branched-subunit amino acid permease